MTKEIFKSGQKLSDIKASDLQKLVNDAADYKLRFSVSPPLKMLHANGGGLHLTWEGGDGFWAKITGQDFTTGGCSWVEVVPKEDGQFELRTDGRTGTTSASPAFAVNGQLGVVTGTYVWLVSGYQHSGPDAAGIDGQEYLFVAPDGMTLLEVLPVAQVVTSKKFAAPVECYQATLFNPWPYATGAGVPAHFVPIDGAVNYTQNVLGEWIDSDTAGVPIYVGHVNIPSVGITPGPFQYSLELDGAGSYLVFAIVCSVVPSGTTGRITAYLDCFDPGSNQHIQSPKVVVVDVEAVTTADTYGTATIVWPFADLGEPNVTTVVSLVCSSTIVSGGPGQLGTQMFYLRLK